MKLILENLIKIVLCILFLYCPINGQNKIQTQENITTILNSDKPLFLTPTIFLKKVWETGGDDPGFIFNNITGIDVDDSSRIYVTDILENNIKIFSNEGKHIKTFGQKGQGPGEFSLNEAITVLPNNRILVVDGSISSPKNRFSFFTHNGDFINSFDVLIENISNIKNKSKNENLWLVGKRIESSYLFSPTHLILFVNYNVDIRNEKSADAICLFNLKNHKSKEIFKSMHTEYENPNYCDDRFSYRLQWTYSCGGDIAVIEDNYIYKILILDSIGTIKYVIERDFKLPLKTKDEFKSSQEKAKKWVEQMRKFGKKIKFNVYKEKSIIYKYSFLAKSMFWDKQERLWILTNEPPTASNNNQDKILYTFDIFDHNGKYLMKVPLDAIKPRCFVYKAGYLYFAALKDDGFPWIFKYKIQEINGNK